MESDNILGCEKMNLDDHPDKKGAKIVVVLRGICEFVTKARNAERAGASLLVVADDKEEDVNGIVMNDNGIGVGINIPSMLIGKGHGRSIIEYANKTTVTL